MASDDDERPPKELLQPLTQLQAPQSNLASSTMIIQTASTIKKPYQITFSSRDEEIKYTQKLLDNCTLYNGDPDNLMSWLRDTGAFIVKERYPETNHPFIIRHLLTDDALDYYLAHEDMIFNFYDLRKLLLHKQNVLAPLQDLTQNDIRKTIIEDLQRSTTKFTGEHRQDVLKWLKTIEIKFETADIPTVKKFDLIPQLLDKGVLDWFQDNKTNFNNSWSVFVDHLKKTFDSPNRARIAMQKLNSCAQSPNQDVRTKVNPTYRLDLLKQKPKDPTEFEAMARDIENIYLVHEAIQQNTQFNTSCSASTSALLPDSSYQPLSNYQQSSRTTNYNSNNRYASSFHNKANYSPRVSFRPSSRQQHTPSFQSSTNRQFGSAANPRNITRQNLFNFQIPSSTQQLQPPLSTLNIPPLMPPSSSVPSTQLSQPTSTVAAITCQWCSQSGHSARDCPF
ncbi:unnamed protein product [Rotaria socialis]|uniref:CCHC-type domain-containing protein n=3 Tax=Rotaria socialis TaxID=392032 RepID=A0A817V1I2_9BILA|nr:unnamed protein product [Rotaria socialis]CAF4327164.1 unnamed protein product [Rotaria socialis]